MTESAAPPAPLLDEKPVPIWQKVVAVGYVAALAALVAVFRGRLHADFWPLDASRVAPNIMATLIQIALATPVAVLLWPPTRRRMHAFVTRHTAPLHARLIHVERQHQRRHREVLAAHAETQRHLQHVIAHHPDIPPLDQAVAAKRKPSKKA